MTELVLWCQSCNGGAGRWQRIHVTSVHRFAPSLQRACSPLLTPHLASASSAHPGHTKAKVLPRTQSSPLLAHWFLHLPHGKDHIPGSHWHSHMPAGTRLGAAQGLRCSRPPAAGARCLLLSCPVQQPWGLGYRTVSNFVPVPRHQGRGT